MKMEGITDAGDDNGNNDASVMIQRGEKCKEGEMNNTIYPGLLLQRRG